MDRPGAEAPIAVFLPSLAGGGSERMALHLAGGLVARSHPVDLVLGAAEGPYLSMVPEGIRVVDLGAGRALGALPGLVRYLRRERPAALLSLMFHANAVAAWARMLARVPTRVVVSERVHLTRALGDYPRLKAAVARRSVRHAYPRADAVVTVSEGVARDLAAYFPAGSTPVFTVNNPTATPELAERSATPSGCTWLDDRDRPVIVSAGRLHRQKDFPTLLRAFARLRSSHDARLVILGEGEERAALNNLADDLGVGGDMALPGFVDNPHSYMARATVFALSSAWEGLPNALIEALALRVPLVATDCDSGPREILEGGRHGRLVPVGDVGALAEALADAIEGRVAPPEPEAAERFTLDRAVEEYRRILLGRT